MTDVAVRPLDVLDGAEFAAAYVSPTNDAMNRVNDVLGFRPVEYCDEWQRDLSA